jgi:hypothetical protein
MYEQPKDSVWIKRSQKWDSNPAEIRRNHNFMKGEGMHSQAPSHVYIYALQVGFCQVVKICQVFIQIVGEVLLTFLLKIKYGN